MALVSPPPQQATELDHSLHLLTLLSPKHSLLPRRDSVLDPLLIAAAAASGPHLTRNHYHHDYFPTLTLLPNTTPQHRLTYVSRQAPRTTRLPKSLLSVKCMARTRIPTPHGPAFLHLYHNNQDSKEHLALVFDTAQLSNPPEISLTPPIRSQSLDAVWTPTETDMDRITRGAYVGRLSPHTQTPSTPPKHPTPIGPVLSGIPPPLVRIHSECFTGETVGSMRCDCGEQLDEAIRLISQPITTPPQTIPGRGAVIYLRQEGRGIGLLSKIRAYNLQDMGHDTVTANLMLGHQADERGYEIACAILRDLGLADGGVRLLTNNPSKVQALEREGVRVIERVPMVPQRLQSDDLERYLRTKVLRMGHLLPQY